MTLDTDSGLAARFALHYARADRPEIHFRRWETQNALTRGVAASILLPHRSGEVPFERLRHVSLSAVMSALTG